jgi:hypothetical protein
LAERWCKPELSKLLIILGLVILRFQLHDSPLCYSSFVAYKTAKIWAWLWTSKTVYQNRLQQALAP